MNRIARVTISLLVVVFGSSRASAGLIFNITNQGGASPQMMTGFSQAAGMWSSLLNDSITVNIRINAVALSPGILGNTSAFFDAYTYSSVRNALLNDATSTDDLSSVANLPSGSVHSMLINRTSNNPNGALSATPYFDTGLGGAGQAGSQNNSTIRMTSANAKAMGLYPANASGSDGTINFTTSQAFDFDRSNGISAGQVDFVGLALHEIGHLLGFRGGIENLISNSTSPGLQDNQLLFLGPIDLFRFSTRSIGTGGGLGVNDWTADSTAKYFSVDGGATSLAAFSTGSQYGDGFEAHHWKNNLGLGVMDPTIVSGELVSISNIDLRAFDVIGYNLTAVPEPSSLVLVGIAGLMGTAIRRRSAANKIGGK